MEQIGFGGGCHWCTEAIFQSLNGVKEVFQGYISPKNSKANFSEAVLVKYDSSEIDLSSLISVHLRTHSSNTDHKLRSKYRSAVYVFNEAQGKYARELINAVSERSIDPIITRVFQFGNFKELRKELQDYYKNGPEKPFCKRYIEPKLEVLRNEFPEIIRKP